MTHTTPTAAAVAALSALTIMVMSGPSTGDAIEDQTEDNSNSQSVVTLPVDGPVTVF